MDAAIIAKTVRRQSSAQYRAATDVKSVLGNVDPMAYDSADAIYLDAVKAMGVKNVKFVVKEEKVDESKAKIVLESVVDGKPDNTPMEFEYRKEGGKWKPVE